MQVDIAIPLIIVRDCLSVFQGLIYEVHISNIYNREKFRRYSYLSDISSVVICGLGFFWGTSLQ